VERFAMAEDFAALFARVRDFDWDPSKRENNLRRRQIDFHDARFVLNGPTIIRRSDRKGETRYMVFGFLDDVEVVFICTIRDETCWIISARRARRDERKKYHANLSRRPAEG
jgi:uncharacterized DUF497 family protein